ncbi:hypothetical protein BDV95DRAFT_29983 [Massariosphaeria phaeospora]|uniref:Uncharacterized protein n=1 Tax=Massariosphaeria phaeospora TaxID=100035 RepID=A0A7C8IA10_9PLEO|nr:hypothetical protein BDV95DRAFT_29983 [Massariosphaeria phaeospora]
MCSSAAHKHSLLFSYFTQPLPTMCRVSWLQWLCGHKTCVGTEPCGGDQQSRTHAVDTRTRTSNHHWCDECRATGDKIPVNLNAVRPPRHNLKVKLVMNNGQMMFIPRTEAEREHNSLLLRPTTGTGSRTTPQNPPLNPMAAPFVSPTYQGGSGRGQGQSPGQAQLAHSGTTSDSPGTTANEPNMSTLPQSSRRVAGPPPPGYLFGLAPSELAPPKRVGQQ